MASDIQFLASLECCVTFVSYRFGISKLCFMCMNAIGASWYSLAIQPLLCCSWYGWLLTPPLYCAWYGLAAQPLLCCACFDMAIQPLLCCACCGLAVKPLLCCACCGLLLNTCSLVLGRVWLRSPCYAVVVVVG
jgi:hypothetical protein